jgi:hypothetical protein
MMTMSSAFLSAQAPAIASALFFAMMVTKLLFHYLVHAGGAAGALTLHRLTTVLHRDLLRILHLFLRFAFNAISDFCHLSHPPQNDSFPNF